MEPSGSRIDRVRGVDEVENFVELLRSGFHSAETCGVCQFFVKGRGETRFYVDVTRDNIGYALGEHARPTTTISMPRTLFSSIIARPHLWDPRNPEAMADVSISGNLEMALFLGTIAKAPAQTGMNVFREAERKARRLAPMSADLARLRSPTRGEILRRLEAGIPFVVIDGLRDAGAWGWSLAEIKRCFSGLRLDSIDRPTGRAFELGDIFRELEAGRESYTHGVAMPAAMRPYFRLPLFPEEAFNTPMLWMGRKSGESGREPCTALHRDTSHGFLAHILGTKRLLLYSPDQAAKVYPEPAYNVFQTCQIKTWQPDYQRFPLSRDLRGIELRLRPMEMLVIPAGWFHEVYCEGTVMSVGTFMNWGYWKSVAGERMSREPGTVHDV